MTRSAMVGCRGRALMDAVDRMVAGDVSELLERRVGSQSKVRSCAWSDGKVATQDGRTVLWWDELEQHRDVAPATTEGCHAACHFDVPHPVGVRTEHRDEELGVVNVG